MRVQQNPGETTNKYEVRMEDTIKVMERLAIDLPTSQRQAMGYLKSLNRAKHRHVLADIKNKVLSIPNNTFSVDLRAMCDVVQIGVSLLYESEVMSQLLE